MGNPTLLFVFPKFDLGPIGPISLLQGPVVRIQNRITIFLQQSATVVQAFSRPARSRSRWVSTDIRPVRPNPVWRSRPKNAFHFSSVLTVFQDFRGGETPSISWFEPSQGPARFLSRRSGLNNAWSGLRAARLFDGAIDASPVANFRGKKKQTCQRIVVSVFLSLGDFFRSCRRQSRPSRLPFSKHDVAP